jgi:hypothetical protein
MANAQPPTEGLWVLDETWKSLKYVSLREIDGSQSSDSKKLLGPSPEDIIKSLSILTPPQKIMYEGLHALGWHDKSVQWVIGCLEHAQLYNCAKLRQQGCAEAEIKRLDALGNQNVTDFSLLKRDLVSQAEEDYQAQLYVKEEVKRRGLVMLGVTNEGL